MTQLFKKVLIANRAEIALRVIRALKDLNIASVAIYSEADKQSRHRFEADYAYMLNGFSSAETYLDIDKIINIAKQAEVDAIHPGYGFLSENHEFAKKVELAGIKFIGPSHESMQKMGDKISARKIMNDAKVPIVPGTLEPLTSWEEIKTLASKIGFPLILKAAAGGGGKGMQVVRKNEELKEAYESCVRQAQEYFGNPQIFCERFIEVARHIEIQVLCDQHGNYLHLFERDCSIQRRHQKLFEEAPSNFLNDTQRQKLGSIAIEAAKAVKYEGVGTVEFICESPEECYFMEMNTRIQVEHPVSEMITGIDLICEQIKVAAGSKISLKQQDIKIHGWALEARINAEDPLKNFLPDVGKIEQLTLPGGPNVRVDTHIYQGYKIPEQYDSMIAKLIVWGKDRQDAISKMLRALSELKTAGISTTAIFHQALLKNKKFSNGDFHTNFLQLHFDEIKESMAQDCQQDELALAVLAAINAQKSLHNTSPNSADLRSRWQARARFEIERSF